MVGGEEMLGDDRSRAVLPWLKMEERHRKERRGGEDEREEKVSKKGIIRASDA